MNKYVPKRFLIATGLLLLVSIAIKIFSLNAVAVERYYSTGAYVYISRLYRIVTGWLPFSIGDILYAAAALWLAVALTKFIIALFKKRIMRIALAKGVRRTIVWVLAIYVYFNLSWGLNYNRLGIADQLHIEQVKVANQDLYALTDSLLVKVNFCRLQLGDSAQYEPLKTVFAQAADAYSQVQKQYPFLNYKFESVKTSTYGVLGDYMGFSGYYNPFSAEAQVNKTIPAFLLPYVTCHEMAHQLGYATEDEANFSGYLAAKASTDKRFQYSVYFDLFNYANGTLYMMDSARAKTNYKLLDTLVRKDIRTYRAFFASYKNPFEPLISALYGNYLKANNQPKGLDTYGDVITWLIAYQKKYKTL